MPSSFKVGRDTTGFPTTSSGTPSTGTPNQDTSTRTSSQDTQYRASTGTKTSTGPARLLRPVQATATKTGTGLGQGQVQLARPGQGQVHLVRPDQCTQTSVHTRYPPRHVPSGTRPTLATHPPGYHLSGTGSTALRRGCTSAEAHQAHVVKMGILSQSS